ncbi:MAG: hypothetical protein ACI9J2_001341 [Saprospiraceae bacterium]
MKKIFNITNGDSAVNLMREGALPGVYLPWRDVLHDGPVPEGYHSQRSLQFERNLSLIKDGRHLKELKQILKNAMTNSNNISILMKLFCGSSIIFMISYRYYKYWIGYVTIVIPVRYTI